MTSDPSATGSATNAAAVAVAAQRGENEAAEESAEQAWVSLARLAAKDKKGFLARFTQLDPNATGYLSAQLFGQVRRTYEFKCFVCMGLLVPSIHLLYHALLNHFFSFRVLFHSFIHSFNLFLLDLGY